MYKILEKNILAPGFTHFKVAAPMVAKKARPGQFVILRIDEKGERIPLTIYDFDKAKGTTEIVSQEVGKTTAQLANLEPGDSLLDFVGPLGRHSKIEKFGSVVCVGGGAGIAPVFPVARALKEAGNNVTCIIGARSKDLLILEEQMHIASNEVLPCTDDGSYCRRGFVTDSLKEIIANRDRIDRVIAIGPIVMMKAVVDITKPLGIKTIVSLNPIMVDGTGMCGSCRVTVGDEVKFVCVDGPDFDGRLVNFDELINRNRRYFSQEKVALEKFKEHNYR